jgi:hypothetical protein
MGTRRSLFFPRSVLMVVLYALTLGVCPAAAQSPDRTVTAITLSQQVSHPGDTIDAVMTVKNLGTAPATFSSFRIDVPNHGSLFFRYYLDVPVAAGQQMDVAATLSLPLTMVRGSHSLTGCFKSEASYDLNYGNDCLTVPLVIDTPNFVDMAAVSVAPAPASLYPEVPTSMTVTVANRGSVTTSANVRAILSTDAQITPADTDLGAQYFQIEPGQSRTLTLSATVPRSFSSTQDYLGFCVAGNSVTSLQTDSTNDCLSAGSVQILSSSLVSEVAVSNLYATPDRQPPGSAITINIVIRNDGPGSATGFLNSVSWRSNENSSGPYTVLGSALFSGVIAANTSLTQAFTATIPSDTTPGYYRLRACLDTLDQLVERDESNCSESVYSYQVDGFRDFEITGIAPPSLAVTPGQSATVTFTARNNGEIYPNGTNAHVIWSEDAELTSLDPELSILDFATDAGGPWTKVASLPVPTGASSGVHYVGVCLDWFNQIAETNENNNCRLAPVWVNAATTPPSSSPVVGALNLPFTNVPLGGVIKTSFTVVNLGALETEPFDLAFYWTQRPEPICSAPCTLVLAGRFSNQASIPAGGTRLFDTIEIPVPSSALAGRTYYLTVHATSYTREAHVFTDSTQFHPVYTSTAAAASNLTTSQLTSGRSYLGLSPGMSFTVGYREQSQGVAPVYQSSRVSYRWSIDNTLGPEDPEILATYAPALYPATEFAQYDTSASITVPADTSVGTNYVFICIDSTNFINETDENNCTSLSVPVNAAPPDYVDLTVSAIGTDRASAAVGEFVRFSFTITNSGNRSAVPESGGSNAYPNYIRWSKDAVIDANDPVMAMVSFDNVTAGGSRTFTRSLQIPSGLHQGIYFIGVCADSTPTFSYVIESSEANNCGVTPVLVTSALSVDLQVSNVTLSASSGAAGTSVNVSFAASNAGNQAVSRFRAALRWSPDRTISETDLFFRQMGWGLGAGGTITVGPLGIDIPTSATPGTYFIGVCSNSDNTITDSDPTNDCAYAPFTVYLANSPQTLRMSMPTWGAQSISTFGAGSSVGTGFAKVDSHTGAMPYGVAILTARQNGVVVSEVGVPSSPPSTALQFSVEARSDSLAGVDVDTGFAIANPGTSTATVTVMLREPSGTVVSAGTATLRAEEHRALFLRELSSFASGFALPEDFVTRIAFGSLEIRSNQPVSVMALRLIRNQRGETLMTSSPVTDLTETPGTENVFLPLFADGGGYTTAVVLLNTSDRVEIGQVRFRNSDGSDAIVELSTGERGTTFPYSLPVLGSLRMATRGLGASPVTGSIEIIPSNITPIPATTGTFRFTQNGVTVTEAAVPAADRSNALRMFVDISGGHNTGVALANPESFAVQLIARLISLDSREIRQTTLTIPARSVVSKFVTEIFSDVPAGFTGQMSLDGSYGVNATTLRSLYNERQEFLLTTLPVINTFRPAPAELVFPQFADGGGYSTQIILLNGDRYTSSASVVRLVPENGVLFSIPPE